MTLENYSPVLVEINKLVEVYRDRPIEIPLIHHEIKEVKVIEEKVVAIENRETEIKEIHVHSDKIVEKDNLVMKTDIQNHIETRVDVVDRFEEKIIPITSTI